jgi:hypothetical protein
MNTQEESEYCLVCGSCGEDGCCSIEKVILEHRCYYAEYYAKHAYFNEMIIEEFHKLAESLGLCRDETGSEVIDPIGDLYDRAWKKTEEKYK